MTRRAFLALALFLGACSASAIQPQAQVAEAVGLAGNRGEPLWVREYLREGMAAEDLACPISRLPAPDCVSARHAAQQLVTAKWVHVREAWESLRGAHGAYASALEQCGGDSGTCGPLDVASVAFDGALTSFRCAVRAIDHAELDPIPGAPACAPSDGGLDAQ